MVDVGVDAVKRDVMHDGPVVGRQPSEGGAENFFA